MKNYNYLAQVFRSFGVDVVAISRRHNVNEKSGISRYDVTRLSRPFHTWLLANQKL